MSEGQNGILTRMLDRLYASLAHGPSLNCRPHNSRQRVDLQHVARLDGSSAESILAAVLSDKGEVKIAGKAEPPSRRLRPQDWAESVAGPLDLDDATFTSAPTLADTIVTPATMTSPSLGSTPSTNGNAPRPPASSRPVPLKPEERSALEAWDFQQAVLRKLSTIAEDARTFEQDTGAQALHIGFPLLHLPPGKAGGRFGSTRRILAPVAFIPVSVVTRKGRVQSVEISAVGHGVDRVMPNTALLVWVQQQTGKSLAGLFADEDGSNPWREINELTKALCAALEVPPPPPFTVESSLRHTPKADDAAESGAGVIPAAVLGLYPLSNQSLVEDMQALVEGEPLSGPIESFVRVGVSLDAPVVATAEPQPPDDRLDHRPRQQPRRVSDERLVTDADPCQARAVRLARETRGLVVHGPPGTGKSQTIANIIGDHLARGERVLFVCDKRTALDVVKHRLDHLGLGQLCAVVHDAQRDQRDLYMGIREQLDGLADAKTQTGVQFELARIDKELQELHDELTSFDAALSSPGEEGAGSFHQLTGEWLTMQESLPEGVDMDGVRIGELRSHEQAMREVLDRGLSERWADNAWKDAVGVQLSDWIARPLADHRRQLEGLVPVVTALDATNDARVHPFAPEGDVVAEATARTKVLEKLREALDAGGGAAVAQWALVPADAVEHARGELQPLRAEVDLVAQGPLDPELAAVNRSASITLPVVLQSISKLGAYLDVARKWYAWFCFGRKKAAREALALFGLSLTAVAAERTQRFMQGLRARQLLGDVFHRIAPAPNPDAIAQVPGAAEVNPTPSSLAVLKDDASLVRSSRLHLAVFGLLAEIDGEPSLAHLRPALREQLGDPGRHADLVAGLGGAPARAAAIAELDRALCSSGLFAPQWLQSAGQAARRGERLGATAQSLLSNVSTVEGILRMKQTLAALPARIAAAVRVLADRSADPDGGASALEKAAIAQELSHRIRSSPELQRIDPDALRAKHQRYVQLDAQKKAVVREQILALWMDRQKQRLLATTGSRLNAAGAELRRRLLVRGERVMRVRQMIAAGAAQDGGDPLFDLRPVWMASPDTVAQIFPRKAMFDVLVFDESSQCRLEEALPVLTRARRVVIAGDPRQLPPTRFFESAVAQSTESEAESEQELFEQQQAEVEDLLSAALNLEIDQAYLDVHYRSQNSDLIEFSNRNFYESRLQAIPGHPDNVAPHAPLRLVHVGGTLDKRVNLKEAEKVVEIVRELLARAEPPSIGIACFNISQRDAILDALDEAAADDGVFAQRLSAARSRRGQGSFEGLFVKNLENVQGDERDHMIISTTYGPDPSGRFYRRFGPLAQAGGGRRLNVLVTRARVEVHLVTSIPAELYRSLPPAPAGQVPNGGWLLFSYLAFAEQLQRDYGKQLEEAPSLDDDGRPVTRRAHVRERPTTSASPFARALAGRLAKDLGISSDVHWGNEGFCIDLALHHPTRAEAVTIGVLCDGARFDKAADRIEWDIFRTRVLEAQGWNLVRLWSPHFFRDPEGAVARIAQAASERIAREPAMSAAAVLDSEVRREDPGRRVVH